MKFCQPHWDRLRAAIETRGCPDDICRGGGGCIHGDGMEVCPSCGGSGEYEPADTSGALLDAMDTLRHQGYTVTEIPAAEPPAARPEPDAQTTFQGEQE